jgi:hypothetical protein
MKIKALLITLLILLYVCIAIYIDGYKALMMIFIPFIGIPLYLFISEILEDY